MLSTQFCSTCGAANEATQAQCFACGHTLSTSADVSTAPDGPLLHERYQLGTTLGSGGYSTVYRGRDMQAGREVAIKQINLQGLNAEEVIEATDTFNREASVLSSLQHPQIPQIYDQFSDQDHWYLVLQFLEGPTLETYLGTRTVQGKPLQFDEILEMALQLGEVLNYLHSRQPPIIFRDLKPSNIIRMPRGGKLCLVDFGIARRFRTGQKRDTQALGSPGYAAPEQYGRAQTTPRSDIYSLGALLHFLLSGDDPAEEVSPGLKPLSLYAETGAEAVSDLVQRMLSPDPELRPATMDEVIKELETVQQQRAAQPKARVWQPPVPQDPSSSSAGIWQGQMQSYYSPTGSQQVQVQAPSSSTGWNWSGWKSVQTPASVTRSSWAGWKPVQTPAPVPRLPATPRPAPLQMPVSAPQKPAPSQLSSWAGWRPVQTPVSIPSSPVISRPVPSRRTSSRKAWIGISLASILMATLLISLHQYTLSTFQQDSCTLTATWRLQSIGTYPFTTYMYYPGDEDPQSISYTITDAQGQVVAQGPGALGLTSESFNYPSPSNTANYDQNQVQISKTTNCWYSPYAVPNVLWNQPGANTFILWLFWLLCSGAIPVFIYQCLLQNIIYPWRLVRRGVQTTGTVVDCVVRRSQGKYGSSYYYVTIVSFQTNTNPPLTGEVETRGKMRLGSKMGVCYDPLNPLDNCRVAYRFDADEARSSTFGGIAMLLFSLVALALAVLSTLHFF